eukprot:TRINITY_DN1024_c1_g1_i1.p1 TRINITY_DN1024_c1_g1~~TRINITY_DN1024_c1_g1_i1.p1  ORF type:complete len:800 (+),score=116.65 TRINITY_DN1024_c1_g1_i1:175-2574(+)
MVSNRGPIKKKKRKVRKKQELDFDDMRKQLKGKIDTLRKILGGKTRRGDVGLLCQDVARLVDVSTENMEFAVKQRVLIVLARAGKRSPIEVAGALSSISFYQTGREAILQRPDILGLLAEWVKTDKPLLKRPVWRLVSNMILDKSHAEKLFATVHDITPYVAAILSDPDGAHALGCSVMHTYLTHFPSKIPSFVDFLVAAPISLTNLIAAGLDTDDDEKPSIDAESAQDLFEMLLLNHHVFPYMIFRDGSGDGVGAILGQVELDLQAAKVCLSAWGTEEGGVQPLSTLPVNVAAMNMVMLAPHSRRLAEVLLNREEALSFLITRREQVVQDLIDVLEKELGAANPKPKTRRGRGKLPQPTPPTLENLKVTLTKFVASVPRTSPEFFDIGGTEHRSEAGYALASSRPGSIVFEKESPYFGKCTVTKYPQWYTVRYNEIEQGIAYTGFEGVPGYAQGTPIPTVLGYEYIKAMAAALLKYGVVFGHKPVVAVGLGSGALPNFVANVFKECKVVVYEIDKVMVEACNAMKLKLAANLDVVLNDAQKGLDRLPNASCSCVLVDAYDGQGAIPKHLREEKFLATAGKKLTHGGVLLSNLHNGPPGSATRSQALDYIKKLQKAIGGTVKIVKLASQQSNMVAIASKPQQKQSRVKEEPCTPCEACTDLIEFDFNEVLGDEFTFQEGETDPDGLPKGLWGVAEKEAEDDPQDPSEDEEEEEETKENNTVSIKDELPDDNAEPSEGSSDTPMQKNVEIIELSSSPSTPPAQKGGRKKVRKVKKKRKRTVKEEPEDFEEGTKSKKRKTQ